MRFKIGDVCRSNDYYDIVKITGILDFIPSYEVEALTKSRSYGDHVVPGYKTATDMKWVDRHFELANDYILDRKLECLEELE